MSSPKKIRADQLLVEQGLCPTRSRAQNLILVGAVFCGTEKVEKPSQLFSAGIPLTIKQKDHPFVSRGGVKLQAALDHFKLEVKDKICLDVGTSTGGFADCLLRRGAKKIYAIDVGYGQIAWSLRQDPRVILFERTNFRYFDVTRIPEAIDLAVADVSFISLTKIIPKIVEIFTLHHAPYTIHHTIALIKPQFELGRRSIAKGGIVKDESKRVMAVEKIQQCCLESGLHPTGVIPSPLLGHEGNQEFLLYATYSAVPSGT